MPMHIDSLNEELADYEDSLYRWSYTYYDSEQRESAIDLYTRLIDEKESEIESGVEIQKYLPFGIVVGAVVLFIGLLGKYYTPKNIKKQINKSDRYCPDCGRAILFDANICPYCEKKFGENASLSKNEKTQKFVEEIKKAKEEAERDKVETIQEEKKMKICPSCGYENKPNSIFCKKCGLKL